MVYEYISLTNGKSKVAVSPEREKIKARSRELTRLKAMVFESILSQFMNARPIS